jgi:hypothetical protein
MEQLKLDLGLQGTVSVDMSYTDLLLYHEVIFDLVDACDVPLYEVTLRKLAKTLKDAVEKENK